MSQPNNQILLNNAFESWLLAIQYAKLIQEEGLSNLGNKKIFVSSLHNAVELYLKQVLLNKNDCRVIFKINNYRSHEEIRNYLQGRNLNEFFSQEGAEGLYSIQFKKMIQLLKDEPNCFLNDFFQNEDNNFKESFIKSLEFLNKERNEETHFYINTCSFLSDIEFVQCYNFMISLTKFIKHYHFICLPTAFGTPMIRSEFERMLFSPPKLDTESFSYKEQLINSKNYKNLEELLAGTVVMSTNDCYAISEQLYLFNRTEIGQSFTFEKLYSYITLLLQFEIIEFTPDIDTVSDEDGFKREQFFGYLISLTG